MKRVSLETISKELGVSKTLISFVLNGKAEEMKISPKMIEKVLKKAKELNYKGNPMARALRTGKSKTLGLVVTDIANPFFSKLARSIEDESMKHGYNLLFGSSDEKSEKSIMLMNLFRDKLVDGLLILPSLGDDDYIRQLQKDKIPNVLIDRYIPGIQSNVVVVNNKSGSFDLVKYLIEKGNKKIGIVTYAEGLSTVDLRIEGYKMALQSFKIPFDETLVKKVFFNKIEKDTVKVVMELIEDNKELDAIFFFNNELAFNGGKIVKEFNMNNVRNISISSFDSFSYMNLLNLPLRYGVQPIDEMGRVATKLLIKQINSEVPLNKKEVLKVKYFDID